MRTIQRAMGIDSLRQVCGLFFLRIREEVTENKSPGKWQTRANFSQVWPIFWNDMYPSSELLKGISHDFICWEGSTLPGGSAWKYKCVLLSPKECTLNHMAVIIAKVYIILVKVSHLFLISSRRKFSLLEKGTEFEWMHLHFPVHTVRMNSLFMTLLTFFCLARIHLLAESRHAPYFGVSAYAPLSRTNQWFRLISQRTVEFVLWSQMSLFLVFTSPLRERLHDR